MKFNNKLIKLTVIAVLLSVSAESQEIAQGLDQASDQLTGVFQSVKTFLFLLAAIVGIYGAFNVYSKYQSQDQDAAKAAAKFGFGFIFIMAAAFTIEAIFIT